MKAHVGGLDGTEIFSEWASMYFHMDMAPPPLTFLRPIARIVGTLTLAFLLFMLFGHLTGDANGPTGMRFSDTREVLSFICFPVLTIIGLALAYRNAKWGGVLAVLSIMRLFTLRPDLMSTAIWLWTIPGLLYLVVGWWSRAMN